MTDHFSHIKSLIGDRLKLIKLALRAVKFGGGILPTVVLTLSVLKKEGVKGVFWRLNVVKRMNYIDDMSAHEVGVRVNYGKGYEKWRRRNEASFIVEPLIDGNATKFSVLMPVYNVPIEFLRQAIESVRNQSYSNWQLCIVDDASTSDGISNLLKYFTQRDSRISIVLRKENGHISAATNDALAMADGDYLVLLDNDDLLHPDALYYVAKKLIDRPDAEIIYSDEDKLSVAGARCNPYFKSEFNPVLFLAQNMICHLGVYRTSTVRDIGGFRVGVEGAQDWDIAWRVIEAKGSDHVVHIPKVLYHWRELPGSTSLDAGEKSYAVTAQVKVIREHLERIGRRADVMLSSRGQGVRVRFELPQPRPLVSIIIPTRDRLDLLRMCIDSLKKITSYAEYEIIIIDNGSTEEGTLQYLAGLKNEPRVKVLRMDIPFNFSTLNNRGVEESKGDLILLMNNDIELTDPDWLAEMVSWAALPEVGCVGAKLWYPDGSLQHGGVILGIGGMAGHAHRGISRWDNGYMGRAVVHQNLSAVTGACLLVKRSIYQAVGGLDEQFAVAYNDIDFCLRVRAAGYWNVWTPYAEMFHHESATRGAEADPEARARLDSEVALMKHRWGDMLESDPAYSPNLTRVDEDFSINVH